MENEFHPFIHSFWWSHKRQFNWMNESLIIELIGLIRCCSTYIAVYNNTLLPNLVPFDVYVFVKKFPCLSNVQFGVENIFCFVCYWPITCFDECDVCNERKSRLLANSFHLLHKWIDGLILFDGTLSDCLLIHSNTLLDSFRSFPIACGNI